MIRKISLLVIAVTFATVAGARTEHEIPFIEQALTQIKAPVLRAYYDAAKLTAVAPPSDYEAALYFEDPRHRRRTGRAEDINRPDYVMVRTYDEATYAHKRSVGTGLIIAGSVMLPVGAGLLILANSNNQDIGAIILELLGGLLFAGGGLGTLIPGIILRTKYDKYVE